MKIVTLAAGVAVGYVLGTKAGREKYNQIAAAARKLSTHPAVGQAQQKAKSALDTVAVKSDAPVVPAKPSASRQPAVVTTPVGETLA
jgi:hypothetical protein